MKPQQPKAGARRIQHVWCVIAVCHDGHGLGNCEHDHATADEATMCPWTPTPWPVDCDLLVRKVRDRRIDPPRTKRRRVA